MKKRSIYKNTFFDRTNGRNKVIALILQRFLSFNFNSSQKMEKYWRKLEEKLRESGREERRDLRESGGVFLCSRVRVLPLIYRVQEYNPTIK